MYYILSQLRNVEMFKGIVDGKFLETEGVRPH